MRASFLSIFVMLAFQSPVIAQPMGSAESVLSAPADTLASPVSEPLLPSGGERTVKGRWTAGNSPYLVSENLVVAVGDSLIIEPGVVVRFSGFHQLKIHGQLISEGTADAGILFTSAQSVPVPGDWWGLLFEGVEAGGILRHSTIQYMSIGVDAKKSGPVTVTECEIADAEFGGVRWSEPAAAGAILGSRILRSRAGVICNAGASPTIAGNTILDNRYAGILCEGGSAPCIERNILVRNRTSGIACFSHSDPLISKNRIVRNGNGINCTASSPKIVGCAIYENEYSGVLCFQQAAPSISSCNLYGNGRFEVRNVSDQPILAEDTWWGEYVADPGVRIYDGADRPGYGKVLTGGSRVVPYPGVPGGPTAQSLALWADEKGAGKIGETAIVENPIWVTLSGTDESLHRGSCQCDPDGWVGWKCAHTDSL
ncbi:MAG: right-handed parallel beta-helix repeat-containing protein [Candidatus Latescibacterota bacterium]